MLHRGVLLLLLLLEGGLSGWTPEELALKSKEERMSASTAAHEQM